MDLGQQRSVRLAKLSNTQLVDRISFLADEVETARASYSQRENQIRRAIVVEFEVGLRELMLEAHHRGAVNFEPGGDVLAQAREPLAFPPESSFG